MNSSSIIERMARYICTANQMDPDSKSHIDGNEFHWQDYVKDAQAALQGLRDELTEQRGDPRLYGQRFADPYSGLIHSIETIIDGQ